MTRRSLSLMARAVACLALIVVMAGLFEAATTVIDPITGHLLIVDVAVDVDDPLLQWIRFRERTPMLETVAEESIPSSFDPVSDQAPAISLNPVSGGVVVVWSRYDGADFELVLARREMGNWSAHSVLTSNDTFDTEPRILVDSREAAHVLWWGDGEGGPVYLQSFDPLNGKALGRRHRPFDSGKKKKERRLSEQNDWDAGGMDEPGIPTNSGKYSASAVPCDANPLALPDHGPVMACGRPAAFILSNCQLVVGVRDLDTDSWTQASTDLSGVDLTSTSVREIVQSIADYQCTN